MKSKTRFILASIGRSSAENEKTAIEWLVLDKKDNKALVISKYALDCQPYNETDQATSWEKCSLRSWLNGTFLNNAFSFDEQAIIATTNVSADFNPKYTTNPGNTTGDKVFLLSVTEAEKYFSTDESLKCTPTAYAKACGAYVLSGNEITCWWWLRSPGSTQQDAARVQINGLIEYTGDRVNNNDNSVRPAMWINLSE